MVTRRTFIEIFTWVCLLGSAFFLGKTAMFLQKDTQNRSIEKEITLSDFSVTDETVTGIGLLFHSPETPIPQTLGNENHHGSKSRFYGIELRGTVAGEFAIAFDNASGREVLLRPGDQIGDAKVEQILRNEVKLNGKAGMETLILPLHPESYAPNNPAVAGVKEISRKDLSELLSNIDRLADEIALQPVRSAQGALEGYKVSSLKPMSLLARMGLRKEDCILSINDQMIQTPEEVHRVLGETVHRNDLKIQIRRGGRDVQMVFRIN